MKHLLLGLSLVLAPVATAATIVLLPAQSSAATSAMGDLGPLEAIAADALTLAKAGDLIGAQSRITDFETAWDAGEATMRPNDTAAWTTIDHAADMAIRALRSQPATTDAAVPAVQGLLATLQNPTAAMPTPTAKTVAYEMTNADGSPVPCETALEEVRRVSADKKPAAADQAKFDELVTKGTERCNADDDKRADTFFGEALMLLNK